ncbi:MAG: cupin domain-containing protein [Defluviitaleaceae bacterium]|nr:cupin domain-containing protein [Defluviitaleaceae bacterium]
MDIIVRKPSEAERAAMLKEPTWGCGVSTFDWHYDSEETCLLTAGRVTVTHSGGRADFGQGDMVTFPRGLSCVWTVHEAVQKHYYFT